MVDNVVTIDVGNHTFIDRQGDTATYSGSVTVNYTTGAVSGNYSITMPQNGGTTTRSATFSQSTLGRNGNDTYTANNAGNTPGFQIMYAGRTPTAAEVQFFDTNGRTYDTANNPAGQQTPSVSSTVTSGTVCFAGGTHIRVARGITQVEVAVEDLRIGDLCVTASGQHRPVRWLGRRSYSGRFANCNPDVLPICFKAGSLADNVPARDLWVSPKHAMFLDGALIPAECLVNGVSIVKVPRIDRIDYYHVELDSHDLLLAEGAASESFVDDQGRQIFHNAHEHAALYPEAARVEAVYCAPRLEEGDALEATRQRVAARAGVTESVIMLARAG